MSQGGENIDFCEYVYNPLMRQYQAMMGLLQMLSGSETQAECNDIECFTPGSPNSPMNAFNGVGGSNQFMTTYLPMLIVWALFAFALYAFRPRSMRQAPEKPKDANAVEGSAPGQRFFNNRDDDDDNSFVS